MRAININSQQWTRFTIPANTNFALITQEQAVCYYAEQNDPADFFQFKEIVGNLPQEREIWLKTQYGESVVLYVENISTIAGFGGSGGGGGGGSYAFSAPLNESGGNVSLNLANDLQVSNNNLTLRLSSNPDFEGVANSIPTLQTKSDSRHSFTSQKIFERGVPIAGFENITNDPYFRIPSMCMTPSGTILCFSDYRKTPRDQVAIEIVCARSVDGGENWTYTKAVTREGADANSRVMDSTCLATKGGKVFVLAGSWSSGTSNWTQVSSRDTTWKAILAVSTDEGQTWTQAEMQFTTANPLPSNVNSFLGGVGAGIEMSNGTLVFPVQFTKARGTVSSGMVWSNDGGATWNWGTGFVDGVSENMIFEDLDGNLVSVGRKDPNTGNARASNITTDMGATWNTYNVLNNRIKAPTGNGCQGSSIFFVTKSGTPLLLMTSPQNRVGGYNRDRITLYASNNTYAQIKEVFVLNYTKGADVSGVPYGGYSCLCYFNGKDGERLFCLFEDTLGIRLTDLTPIIAELENFYTPQRGISLLSTIEKQLPNYVSDQLLTEYSNVGFNKGVWIDSGNWLPLNVLNSRAEVSEDPDFEGMIKFSNTVAGDDSNYVESGVLGDLSIINTPEVSFDFDLVIPTTQVSGASNYINVFVTNNGVGGGAYTYGLLFAKSLTSGNLVINPVGSWGNSSTFQIADMRGQKLHFTMVYTNTTCKIYLNGNTTPVFSNTFTRSTYLTNAKKLIMGNSQDLQKKGAFSIGNFKIYTKALTEEEVVQNYKASLLDSTEEEVTELRQRVSDLEYRLNKQTYPQFDAMEINLSPSVFKKGKYSLGELPPSASGAIPLRNGSTLMTTFGIEKNTGYTASDIAYNSQDGYFYIGQNNRLIHFFTNGLLNSKLTQGKYTMQFTCEATAFANSWKNPVYIQVNGNFSTSATDTAFKDNSNRIEVGQFSSGTIPMYAYNWKGGTQQDRSVTLPTIAENQKVSGVSVFNGSTTSVYIRVAGQPNYSLQGTMDASIPNGNNIRAIGFVRGNSDCASIKIYELRFWAGVALTEAEINGKLLDLSMPL